MNLIESKRNIFQFAIFFTFIFIFYIGLGSFMIYLFIDSITNGQIGFMTYFTPTIAMALFGMCLYSINQWLKQSPKILVDDESISFNDEKYHLTDIKKIIYTGKMPFKYLFEYKIEGASIEFNNGRKRYIFDDMYSNTWQIKSFLRKLKSNKLAYQLAKSTEIDRSSLVNQQFESYKDNQFTSLRGIIFWSVLGCFIYLGFLNGTMGFCLFIGIVSLLWFWYNAYLMHYFCLSDDFLVIKNHHFIWKKHVYTLSNIEEVTFETAPKMPNCLRVITKDFRNKIYPAGSINDKTWLRLQAQLQKKRIKVRNECI